MKSNMFKRLVLLISSTFLVLTSVLALPATVRAQTWYNQNPFEWYVKVYDENTSPSNEIFGERYTASQVQWVIYSVAFAPVNIVYSLLGMSPTPSVCFSSFVLGTVDVNACLTAIPDFLNALADKIPQLQANVTGSSSLASENGGSYIWRDIFLKDRPLSGISYVRGLGRKLTLIPEAKAADTYGFSRLAPIQPLWKLTRNIAYFFFVIIILVAAFMIMFKVKMSPQTIVTIQSALPKIVVTLILVTFSYAIAGFMVDLVYVVMGLFSQFFTPIVANQGSITATYKFLNGWLGDGFLSILVYSILYLICSLVISIIVAIISIGTLNIASVLFGLFIFIFFAINTIILIIYIFLGLFNLFKALAGFYVAVIFGPIQLALGALPSSHGTFGKWLKSMIGKLAVFPAQGILWYFGFIFLFGALSASIQCWNLTYFNQATLDALNNGISKVMAKTGAPPDLISQFVSYAPPGHCWGPPLLGNAGSATAIAFLLISASCILLLGKVHKMIESALAGKEFDMESAVSQPIKMGVGAAGGIYKVAGEEGTWPVVGGAVAHPARAKAIGDVLKMLSGF